MGDQENKDKKVRIRRLADRLRLLSIDPTLRGVIMGILDLLADEL